MSNPIPEEGSASVRKAVKTISAWFLAVIPDRHLVELITAAYRRGPAGQLANDADANRD
jgi:hypothetical protein